VMGRYTEQMFHRPLPENSSNDFSDKS